LAFFASFGDAQPAPYFAGSLHPTVFPKTPALGFPQLPIDELLFVRQKQLNNGTGRQQDHFPIGPAEGHCQASKCKRSKLHSETHEPPKSGLPQPTIICHAAPSVPSFRRNLARSHDGQRQATGANPEVGQMRMEN
jgi:hypothetical protein